MQNFSELQCLVDDLVDFLELCLSMLLYLKICYLMISIEDSDNKKTFVRYHLYFFS